MIPRAALLLLLLPLPLAACAPDAPPPPRSPDTSAAIPPPAPVPPAAPPATRPSADVTLKEKTPLIDYSYAWPGVAAAIPALDARFRADARTSRQRVLNGAKEDRNLRRQDDFPFHPYSLDTRWTMDGEAAGLLSLRGETYSYTGGAHGNTGWEYILWDRVANRDITPLSLFRDPAAARALLVKAFCPALDLAREEKRGEPVTPDPTGKDWMTTCPEITRQLMVLSDAKNGQFTAIRVLIGPYEAGPYAEGSYEVRLPVTSALAALLKRDRATVLAPPTR